MNSDYDYAIDDIEALKHITQLPLSNYILESSSQRPVPHSPSIAELKNNGWNHTIEKLLQQWGEQSKGFQWMYNRTSVKYDRWNKVLGFASIALGSTAGTLSFLNLIFEGTEITILAGLSGYVASMFGAMFQFLALEKKSRVYKFSSIKYQNLATDIEYQLSLFRRDRHEGKVYIEEVKKLFDRYKADCPPIPIDVANLFIKTFGENNLSKPDIAGEINKIIIKKNESGSSSSSSNDGSPSNSRDTNTDESPIRIISRYLYDEPQNKSDNKEIVIQIENNNPETFQKTAQAIAKQLTNNSKFSKKRKKSPNLFGQLVPTPIEKDHADGYLTA